MYVYVQTESGLYTVGFYKPDGRWVAESDHRGEEGASARVHYLNGGGPESPTAPCKAEYEHE